MKPSRLLALLLVLALVSASGSTRPDPTDPFDAGLKSSKSQHQSGTSGGDLGGLRDDGYFGPGGGFFGPGGGGGGAGAGFDIPGFGSGIYGGGYGSGYGGPSGGYGKGGVVRPTVVCKEKGPCYGKKLTCPAKCFTSYSSSGKGYGGGGGGGGCTMDCSKRCTAYC